MSRPLRHPWWLHLPTLLALAVCIAVPPLTRPWPPRPRGYTWEDWAMPVALLIVLLAWEVAASELWIRAENGRKRFNRYLLWPAGLGGWMAGIQIGIYWARLQGITPQSTIYAAGGAAFCLAGTAILECLRRPLPQVPAAPAPADIGNELRQGDRWTYFTVERSRWISRTIFVLLSLAPLCLICTMDGRFRHLEWTDLVIFLPWLLILLLDSLVGSLRIQVNPTQLVLRSGLGFPLLRVRVAEISSIGVESVHPFADFRGWGIQSRHGMRAYLFGGSRGVRIETRQGKKYLIGCREPERLASVLRAAAPAIENANAQ